MQNPANLDIWHRSVELAVRINQFAFRIPGHRAPGIANQVRRASMSIPANIAEGAGQDSPVQNARFISIAVGSAFELESHLVLAKRICPEVPDVDAIIDELQQIRRMMFTYRTYQLNRVQRERKPRR